VDVKVMEETVLVNICSNGFINVDFLALVDQQVLTAL